jgi:hypothetical protein
MLQRHSESLASKQPWVTQAHDDHKHGSMETIGTAIDAPTEPRQP